MLPGEPAAALTLYQYWTPGFSGLKTALLYYLKKHPVAPDSQELKDVAASYQEAIVDALAMRCRKAIKDVGALAVGGGVSLNSALRARLSDVASSSGVTLLLAEPRFCGDNAAMIAGLASSGGGIWGDPAMALDAEPNLPICGVC